MRLSHEQRKNIESTAVHRLALEGLFCSLGPWVDPDDGAVEDCLFVMGSHDGPYMTSRFVGSILMMIDEAFAGLLIMKDDVSRPWAASPAVEDQWVITSCAPAATPVALDQFETAA